MFIQRLKNLDRKKSSTYIILGSILLLVLIIMSFSMLLRGDSASTPLITTKLRAALLTYKRTIIIKGATPTPIGSGGLPGEVGELTPTGQKTLPTSIPLATRTPDSATNAPSAGNVTPTDTVIFDENNPEDSVALEDPTETPADLLAEAATETPAEEITEEESPTQAATLPETGSVQYPIILFISATVFLFISFLF